MKKYQISNIKYQIDNKKLIFAILFIVLGLISLQIPINVLAGAKVKFTLFDLFVPISGAFLGSAIGIVAVVTMQLVNLIIHGFSGIQTDSILKLVATLRFLPLIFGVWYLSLKANKSSRLILLVPLLSIVAFISHPIGKTVWYYSLFWLIPLIVWPLRHKFLFVRALGSTFMAHSVGGAAWIWAFNLPANVWISLIPIVIIERAIFALGISASYIFMNNILAYLNFKKIIPQIVALDKKYIIRTLNPKL